MSDYSFVMDLIEDNNTELKEKSEKEIKELKDDSQNDIIEPLNNNTTKLFDLQEFGNELYNKSCIKNKNYHNYVENISAYDIAANCIRSVVFKLLKTPVKSYADKWLPLAMRGTIGNAIHDFIQLNSLQFTEKEVCLKIPSIHFSGRLDCLINDNVLVEIKSVPYNDYKTIIKKERPRTDDFYQSMVYKYIIENYLEEAKDPSIKVRNGIKPKLDNYNIEYIQFIYVAHDLIAADKEDLSQMLKSIKELKSFLNSKKNKFFFMTQLSVNTTPEKSNNYIEYIKYKIDYINYYISNNKIPDMDCVFVDTKKCFFCQYKQICRKQ